MSDHPKAESAVRGIEAMMADGTWHQSDYERLDNARCQIGNLLGEIAELEARIAELEALVREAAEYLDYNGQTSIGHGSILHQKFRAASAPQEDA